MQALARESQEFRFNPDVSMRSSVILGKTDRKTMAQVGFEVGDVQVAGFTGNINTGQRKESHPELFLSPCICWEMFEQVAQSHQE